MGEAIAYLNDNPGVGVVIAGVAVLVTIMRLFIKSRRKINKSNEANVKNVKESKITIDQENR